MNTKKSLVALMIAFSAVGCGTDLGECDPNASTLDMNGDGVNDGQAVVNGQCVSCHSANSEGVTRHGAPYGLNFDVPSAVTTDREMQVFNAGLTNVRQYAEEIWEAVDGDYMPPAGPMAADSRESLRNWLACGAPATASVVDVGSSGGGFEVPFMAMHSQCTACHSTAAKLGGFVWGDGDICETYNNIVGQPAIGQSCSGQGNYIEPGNPESSILVQKCSMDGAAACGAGTVMPSGAVSLQEMNADVYNALVQWVMAGAPKPDQCQ